MMKLFWHGGLGLKKTDDHEVLKCFFFLVV